MYRRWNFINSERKLLRDRYYEELKRKNDFDNRLNFPITLMSLFIALLGYIFTNLSKSQGIPTLIFYSLFGIFLLFFSKSVYHLVLSIYNYDWVLLPPQEELKNAWNEFTEYYQGEFYSKYNKKEKDALINEDFENTVDKHYREGLKNNLSNNDKKSLNLHKTYEYLIYSGIPLFLMGILLFFTPYNTEEQNKYKYIFFIKEVNELTEKTGTQTPPPKPQPVTTSRIIKDQSGGKK